MYSSRFRGVPLDRIHLIQGYMIALFLAALFVRKWLQRYVLSLTSLHLPVPLSVPAGCGSARAKLSYSSSISHVRQVSRTRNASLPGMCRPVGSSGDLAGQSVVQPAADTALWPHAGETLRRPWRPEERCRRSRSIHSHRRKCSRSYPSSPCLSGGAKHDRCPFHPERSRSRAWRVWLLQLAAGTRGAPLEASASAQG